MEPRWRWVLAVLLASFSLAALAATRPELLAGLLIAVAAALVAVKPTRSVPAVLLLMLCTPVTINLGWPGQTLTWLYAALLALIAIATVARVVRRRDLGTNRPELWSFLPLVTIVALSLLSWPGLDSFLISVRPYLVSTLSIWYVVSEVRLSPTVLNRTLELLLNVSVVISAIAITQRLLGYWPILDDFAISTAYRSFDGQDRAAGLMGQPVIYGSFCLAMIVLVLTIPIRRASVYFLANLVGLLASGTRGAILSLIVVLCAALFHRSRSRIRFGLVGAVIGGAVLTSFLIAPSRVLAPLAALGSRLSNITSSESAAARELRVDIAWSRITDSPSTFFVGRGPGAAVRFLTSTSVGDNLAQTIDNSYLTLWFDFGLLGVLCFVGLLVVGIARGSWPGRAMLLAFAVEVFFFDFYNWPSVAAVLVLGASLRHAHFGLRTHQVGAEEGDAGVSGRPQQVSMFGERDQI